MVNTQTCTSCLKMCQNIFVNKIVAQKKIIKKFMAYKFVTTFHDKNVIHNSTIWGKKFYMMMWHVIPHHINLGSSISMSCFLIKKI